MIAIGIGIAVKASSGGQVPPNALVDDDNVPLQDNDNEYLTDNE